MFIGHLGIGLGLKTFDNKTNLAIFFAAVLFLDILLWLFVLTGIEEIFIPTDYLDLHYLHFNFPYSHGLVASLIWTTAGFTVVYFLFGRKKTSIVLAFGILSHFVLDLIVHPPQIPLIGQSSVLIGFGLWDNIYLALSLELVILLIGFTLYYKSTSGSSLTGKIGMPVFLFFLTALLFLGQLNSPKPEFPNQVAASSLISIFIILLMVFWLDKKRTPGQSK